MSALHIIAKNWVPFKIKAQLWRSTAESRPAAVRKQRIDFILWTERCWMMLWNAVNGMYMSGKKYMSIYSEKMYSMMTF